jgi:uncharacterized protein DUF4382
MRRVPEWLRRLGILAAVVPVLGCGGSGTSGPTNQGTLSVRLTDSPFGDARAVLVTFSEVTAHRSGEGGFSTLPFSPPSASRTCDLKRLVGAQDVLGTGPLPAGHYTQLRLVVSSATLYFDNATSGSVCAPAIAAPAGRSAPVDIPSGEVRLNREFDVTAGNVTTITLDFDGERSIRETGNGRFVVTPVIAVVSVQ